MATTTKKAKKKVTKPKSPKASKKELDELSARIDQWESKHACARGLGTHVAQVLQRKWTNDTDIWSSAIAQIFIEVEDDMGSRRGCRNLLLRWTLEKLTGMMIMKALPDIHNVYQMLKSLRYTENDPLVFNDLDNKAWWIPAENKKVFVMQSQCRFKLVIIDSNLIMDRIHVRRLWYKWDEERNSGCKFRTLKWFKDNNWKPTYGDCRDEGYVLSYECMTYGTKTNKGKVDRGNHYEPQQFLDDILWTQAALHEAQTSRLSEIHKTKSAGK